LRWSNILFDKSTGLYLINDFEHGAYLKQSQDSFSVRSSLLKKSTDMHAFGLMIEVALREGVQSQPVRIFIQDKLACSDVIEKIRVVADELLFSDEDVRPSAEVVKAM
jgi:hypothetical protein